MPSKPTPKEALQSVAGVWKDEKFPMSVVVGFDGRDFVASCASLSCRVKVWSAKAAGDGIGYFIVQHWKECHQ